MHNIIAFLTLTTISLTSHSALEGNVYAKPNKTINSSINIQRPTKTQSTSSIPANDKDYNAQPPTLIHHTKYVSVWTRASEFSGQGIGAVKLVVSVPPPQKTTNEYVLSQLYPKLLMKSLSHIAEEARKNNLEIVFRPTAPGGLTLELVGMKNKHLKYTKDIFYGISTFSIKENDLKEILNGYKFWLDQRQTAPIEQNFHENISNIVLGNYWTKEELNVAANLVTMEAIEKYHRNFNHKSFAQLLLIGDYSEESILSIVSFLDQHYSSRKLDVDKYHFSIDHLNTRHFRAFDYHQHDSGLMSVYLMKDISLEKYAKLKIIEPILTEFINNHLKKEMPSSKHSDLFVTRFGQYPALVVRQTQEAQSFDTQHAISHHFKNFPQYLSTVGTAELHYYQDKLLENYKDHKPVNIFDEALPFFQDLEEGNLQFDTRFQLLEFTRQRINKKQLEKLVNDVVFGDASITIHVSIEKDFSAW